MCLNLLRHFKIYPMERGLIRTAKALIRFRGYKIENRNNILICVPNTDSLCS